MCSATDRLATYPEQHLDIPSRLAASTLRGSAEIAHSAGDDGRLPTPSHPPG